ncbi:MAG: cupin domain-containing protein [Dehalococcoidia bacterium]
MTLKGRVTPEEEEHFYEVTDQASLRPAWRGRGLERNPSVVPFAWRWADAKPLVLRSGEIVTPDRDVERRVLRLANPGLEHGTTHTISAALQLLLPGENAPAHRHTPTAIRWVLEGSGAYTTVEGDKCYMEPGDLILTPSWTWHDHNNEGDQPLIWMDGLDTPLVHNLEATFYEAFPEDQQPVVGVGESERKYASGALRPAWEDSSIPYSPLWHYKWDRTYEALQSWPRPTAVPSTMWPWSTPIRPLAVQFCAPCPAGFS